jgi:AAA+ ATPase superfamily predicted ATPase
MFAIQGSDYTHFVPPTGVTNNLPVGIYHYSYNTVREQHSLSLETSQLCVKKDIYGFHTHFEQRILNTWNKTSKNLGVMLYGPRGVGKSFFLNNLLAKLSLPAIIINDGVYDNLEAFTKFLSWYPEQSFVLLFEEFDKQSLDNGYSWPLLGILDGANNTARLLSIFTTNHYRLNERISFVINLTNRPGRIRYKFYFKPLSEQQVSQITDSLTLDPDIKAKALTVISKLDTASFDLVSTIVNEIILYPDLSVSEILDTLCIYTQSTILIQRNYSTIGHVLGVNKVSDLYYKNVIKYFEYTTNSTLSFQVTEKWKDTNDELVATINVGEDVYTFVYDNGLND